MGFLFVLSIISTIVLILSLTLALAAGLYFLSEVVEEYTIATGKILRYLIWANMITQIGLGVFESFPIHILSCNLLHQTLNLVLLGSFPIIKVTSCTFMLNAATLILNHYWAFNFFGNNYFPFMEVLAYFTLSLWIVPFIFFVSLSANEHTLPTTSQSCHEPNSSRINGIHASVSLLNKIKTVGFFQEKCSNYNHLKI